MGVGAAAAALYELTKSSAAERQANWAEHSQTVNYHYGSGDWGRLDLRLYSDADRSVNGDIPARFVKTGPDGKEQVLPGNVRVLDGKMRYPGSPPNEFVSYNPADLEAQGINLRDLSAPPVREPTDTDLNNLRTRYGGVQGDTVAIGFTNVPGLEGEIDGLSTKRRRDAGLSEDFLNERYGPDRIKAPVDEIPQTSALRGHAEEHLIDEFDKRVQDAGLTPQDLDGKTLNIRISKDTGVCTMCAAGLDPKSVASSGVIKQLSEKYRLLTIRVTVEGGVNARPNRNVLRVRDGKLID
jgi:hypothetical protein